MDNRAQTVGVLERTAPELARRDRWPAGLLPRVQIALMRTDPWGRDSVATRQEWYTAAYEQLAAIPTTPAEVAAIKSMLDLAQGASGAFVEEQAGALGQIQTQAGVFVDNVVQGLDTTAKVITSPWTYVAGAAVAGLVAWAVLKK
jgi:hypothetical protein